MAPRIPRRRALRALTIALAAAALAAPASALGARLVWSRAVTAAESLLGGVPRSGSALLHAARVHQRHHARSGRELTPIMAALAARMRSLPSGQRREAARLLARPSDGDADPQQNGYTVPEASASPYCSAHYCVHWVASTADAPDPADANHNGVPDWVETVDAVAENVYSVENGQLGWRAPKGDGRIGGGLDKTDIYLKDLGGTGIYGYTSPDPGQPGVGQSQYAYLVIDNSFSADKFPRYATPLIPLEVTLAHEYNHVLQFSYDALADTWFMESSAVWAEGKVYPDAHDYLQYVPGWVALTQVPLTSFDGTNPNDRSNVKVYGSSVWNKWLDNLYGPTVVRTAWEDSAHTNPSSFGPAAYDASIRALHGRGFFDAFSRFSAATADWATQNSGFPDGSLYPDVDRLGTLTVDGGAALARLDHATFALIDVPPASAPRIKFVVKAPRGTASAIALVARSGPRVGGTESPALTELPRGGLSAVTLANPAADARITAVLVNGDVSQNGYSQALADWAYMKDSQPYTVTVTTDFTTPVARPRSPRAGARNVGSRPALQVAFSKPMSGITTGSVELRGPHGRVRIRVHFKDGASGATIVPVGHLRRGARYRVLLRSSITDTDDNHLTQTSWTFTTRR